VAVHFQGRSRDLNRILLSLPDMLAGKAPDPYGIVQGLKLRLGTAFLSRVQQAFLVKSAGGRGDDGIAWKPLKPATIAQRRTTRAERKQLGITGKRVRGLLTPAEDKLWRGIFASMLAQLRARGVGEGEAKGIAARIAWAKLKAMGAKTKLGVLGSRTVAIGRDTGRMLRSLAPGVDDRPSGEQEQVFQVSATAVAIGTNVPYAGRFHSLRPLWPDEIPPPWMAALHAALARGLTVALRQVVERG
jgi:hypothetical protein